MAVRWRPEVRQRRQRQQEARREAGRRRRRTPASVIYFVQAGDDGPIKIGRTTKGRLHARLQALQCGNPETLTIIGTRPGGEQEELSLHRSLAEHHIRGEWFRPAPAVLRALEAP